MNEESPTFQAGERQCFSYALARQRDEALLFVGADFPHTDVRSARE